MSDQRVIHVALVGISGAGKSTLLNVLDGKGKEIANVNRDARPCTTKATPYEMVEGDTKYCIWDTRGLNEGVELAAKSPRFFRMPWTKEPDAESQLKKLLHGNNPEIDFILFCVDARSIKSSIHRNIYKNIWADFGERKPKVAVVINRMQEVGLSTQWIEKWEAAAGKVVDNFPDATLMEGVPEFRELHEQKVKDCKGRIFGLISRTCGS